MLQTPSHSPLYAFPKGGGGLGGMLHHPQRIHIALKVFLTGSSKGTGKRNPFTITFSFLLSFLLCHQWMSPFWALHRLSYLDPTKPWRQTSAFFKACGHQLPRPSDVFLPFGHLQFPKSPGHRATGLTSKQENSRREVNIFPNPYLISTTLKSELQMEP